MRFKQVSIIPFVILLISTLFLKAYADEVEAKFKDICIALAKELSQTIAPIGRENAVSDKEREDTFTRQRKLFKECQEELRGIIETNPRSVWGDDAQYVIAALSIEDPKQQATELERVLKDYPDIRLEDWTQEKLGFLLPKNVDEQIVRLELCILYRQLGEADKLKNLFEESIKKFPEKTLLFERMLKKP